MIDRCALPLAPDRVSGAAYEALDPDQIARVGKYATSRCAWSV